MTTRVQLVIPVHNEADTLPALLSELELAFTDSGIDLYVVVVDDGSTDDTARRARESFGRGTLRGGLRRHVKRMGQTRAIRSGLRTDGQFPGYFAICDGDGQDDPKELKNLILKIIADESDLVYGIRSERKDPMSKTVFSAIANRLFARVLGHDFRDLSSPMKVFSLELQESFLRISGNDHRYLPVIAASEGFFVEGYPVVHRARSGGKSKYGFGRALNFLEDLVALVGHVEAKVRPLRLPAAIIGISLLVGSIALVWAGYLKFALGHPLTQSPAFFFGIASAWNALLMFFVALLFRR